MSPRSDEPALRAFLARDLGAVTAAGGLPEGLSLEQVAATLGADPGRTVRWFLGSPPEEAFWCPAVGVDGFDDTVKIWFRRGIVVKLTGEWPDLATATLAPLGPPDLELDHRMDTLVVESGEKVWADRGLGVTLNRSGTMVVELSTFTATTAEEYRRQLAGVSEYRESPAPEI
jgi:hypothetical protein